jgi:hypothetical protein
MDEIVLRSMLKWPDVPSVYGWLRLDRRGQWWIRMPERPPGVTRKSPAGTPAGEPPFERIVNPAMIEFIGRNYAHDAEGRFYFQNGPQRVFVTLDYTPWVYRLDEAGRSLVAHTGAPAGRPRAVFFDERGGLLLDCDPGVGAVLDRDLGALAERFADGSGRALDAEGLLALARAERSPDSIQARLMGAGVAVAAIRSDELAMRFRFVARPRPAAGEPDC